MEEDKQRETFPSFKVQPRGTDPPLKIHPRGSVSTVKMHSEGTLNFNDIFVELDLGIAQQK